MACEGWEQQAARDRHLSGHPVACVSWNDATAYATWLSLITGKTYKLLSEAEREYVVRVGSTTPFWWGSTISTSQANYNGNYKATVPVYSFPANPWGLYSVHGNVWEWTQDCWNRSNSGNPGNGGARSFGNCNYRVIRGGSKDNDSKFPRSASRLADTPDSRDTGLGFRVARTL